MYASENIRKVERERKEKDKFFTILSTRVKSLAMMHST